MQRSKLPPRKSRLGHHTHRPRRGDVWLTDLRGGGWKWRIAGGYGGNILALARKLCCAIVSQFQVAGDLTGKFGKVAGPKTTTARSSSAAPKIRFIEP